MISDDKKEEIRATADIVEVVGDYVKLKKSGSGFMGLCPFHNEKTPSFHVTPRLGIYKCFGCGESGDVFNFVMQMEGISFPESLRTLAERYGIDIPDDDDDRDEEQTQKREGIYYALKFAGLFYHTQLHESEEAEKARNYLEKRGYGKKIQRSFGLGYAPSNNLLLKAAQKEGIKEEYLAEADLIKPSNRGEGFYDTFRDRLIFPIFNPSGKVIAFAGRILNESKKTAKYINSAQTAVYNKSEVVFGVNFAKNEIRKAEEVILVEGYTDVITMNMYGIKNVVASSGTSLTNGQIRILQRYGNRIIMIYDADSAGQAAMQRGMNIALEEGMEVQLMELPDGEDPDSFVKQFGKESFLDYKQKHAEDFVTFSIQKAEKEGKMENAAGRSAAIKKILESIALIPNELDRQFYVQDLHQKTQVYRKGSDRELFNQLDIILAEKKRQDRFRSARENRMEERASAQSQQKQDSDYKLSSTLNSNKVKNRLKFELKIIQLLIKHGKDLREFVGQNIGPDHFEDEDLKTLFKDIMNRHVEGKEISEKHYLNREKPFPSLIAEIHFEPYSASEEFAKVTGGVSKPDRNLLATIKSNLKLIKLEYLKKKYSELYQKLKNAEPDQKEKIQALQSKINREINRIENTNFNELFDDPDFFDKNNSMSKGTFEYTMKTRDK